MHRHTDKADDCANGQHALSAGKYLERELNPPEQRNYEPAQKRQADDTAAGQQLDQQRLLVGEVPVDRGRVGGRFACPALAVSLAVAGAGTGRLRLGRDSDVPDACRRT